ncbi:MAG: hypothetical protein ABW208_21135 [Pyrinomonadaceae bacterium]
MALLSGCGRGGVVVDSQKARAFSDSFMDGVVHDRRDAMYSKMEPEFHGLTSRQQFDDSLNTLYERVGKPLKFEQVSDGPGVRVLYNGQPKPTHEVIYSVTTTKGTYPLKVRVVNNGDALAVTLFTFNLSG